jgi:hypothetical protein
MTSVHTTISTHWRRRAVATLFAATAIFGGTAVVDPATASAKPTKFDEDKWQQCAAYWIDQYEEGHITEKERDGAIRLCCASSGGEWDYAGDKCSVPDDAAAPRPLPQTIASPGGVPTHVLQPVEPPANVPPTLAPVG